MRLLDKLGGIRERLGSIVTMVRARLPKTRRGKILFYGALAIVAMGFVGGLSVAVWSSFPSFCPSCHHVEPYYDSWGVSVHGKENVTCTDCHFKPGLVPYAMGKANGMVEVVKYFSGAVPVKLRSEVQDVSCLREGCHNTDELGAQPVEFGKSSFRHDKHRGELRGMRLRCASCHSTSLHSEGDTVSTRKCYTCHFKVASTGEETGKTAEEHDLQEKLTKCDACHEIPKEVTTHAGKTFDHEEYASDDGDCSRCHANVTRGDGAVAKDQCITCHNEGLGHLDKYAEPEEVHEIHVTEHQVACFECHEEIRHGVKGVAAVVPDSPDSFLARALRPVTELYGGSGGSGVEDLPDPMFATEVQCEGCHDAEDGPETAYAPAYAACVDCHEAGYDEIAKCWKLAFDGYLQKLSAAHVKAASIEGLDAKGKALLAEAASNIQLVRRGRAVHNVRYADRCLRQAEARLAEVLRAAGMGDAAKVLPAREPEAGRCLEMCHIGVETLETLRYADMSFPHDRHLLAPEVACSECHAMEEEKHGETHSESVGDCNGCHHKEEEKGCESCHPAQEAVYSAETGSGTHARPAKAAEKEVTCVSCHAGISGGHSRETVKQLCQECHKGQKARGKMLDEWQVGIQEELAHLEALVRRANVFLAGRPILSRERVVALREAVANSLRAAERVRRDGSRGAHNIEYVYSVLSAAREELTAAMVASE